MRRIGWFLAIAVTAGLGPFALTAHAAPTVTCTSTLSSPPSIPGNVVVPAGETCFLKDATVGGNVTVQPGGRLSILRSVIQGNVTSTNAGTDTTDVPFSVFICNSKVVGNVTITGSASDVVVGGGPGCAGNSIGGDVVLTGNRFVQLDYNSPNLQGRHCSLTVPCRIGGNVTVSNNKRAEIIYNKIYGDLTCRDNVCGLDERGNTVLGVRRGDCVSGSNPHT
jgi:hypothetical protein